MSRKQTKVLSNKDNNEISMIELSILNSYFAVISTMLVIKVYGLWIIFKLSKISLQKIELFSFTIIQRKIRTATLWKIICRYTKKAL